MLLAIAMSSFYMTTHVHYVPPGTEFTKMLRRMRETNHIEPMGENFYKLTQKGRNYLKKLDIERFKEADKAIDEFVENL